MRFNWAVIFMVAATILVGMRFFPKVLAHIHHNDEIRKLVKHPDAVFYDFSRCKREVDDVSHCYNAYSAALQIADSKDCSPQGILMKRKFKNLVEHAYPRLSKKKSIRNAAQGPGSDRLIVPAFTLSTIRWPESSTS